MLPVLFCFMVSNSLQAQVKSDKDTPAYKKSLRNMVPEKWYLTAPAIIRVRLKKGSGTSGLSLYSLVLNAQLDSIARQGYTGIEIFATPYGGKSYGGLDAIDRYRIDPAAGTMDDSGHLLSRRVEEMGKMGL